jgi:hypothetical protein
MLGLLAIAAALSAFVPPAGAAQDGATTSVINGREAAAGTYGYMAFVVFSNGEEAAVCSGTVVSSNVVLTAAHCVLDDTFSVVRNPANITVVTGNVDWASPDRTVSAVSRVAVDPSFAYTVPGYAPVRGDAALLELSLPVAAPPVKLATSQTWTSGTEVVMAGWGKVTANGGAVETLRVGEATVQAPEYCRSKSSHFESAWSLCVLDSADARYSVCNGDSGGPLLMLGPAGEPLEIGVASYGVSKECSPALPQYFTRADAIAPWVAQKIGEWAPQAPAAPPVPTPTPAPAAAPSTSPPAPTLPVMSRAQAKTYATRALQLGLGGRFRGRSRYRASCAAVSSSRQRCSVAWTRGTKEYWGTVTVYYAFDGGKVVWGDRYRVQTLTNCNHRWGYRCSRQTFRS